MGASTGDSESAQLVHGELVPDSSQLSSQIAGKLEEVNEARTEGPPPPRLSLAHLFVWTTLSAVFMALGRSIFLRELGEGIAAQWHAARVVHWSMMSIMYGLHCTGLWIEVSRWWRQGPVKLQPGEWLVVLGGASFLASLTVSAAAEALFYGNGYRPGIYVFPYMAQLATALVVSIWAAVRIGKWDPWRGLFVIHGATSALMLVIVFGIDPFDWMFLSAKVVYVTAAIEAVFLLVGVLTDGRQWRQRNWLHWLGVVMYFLHWVSFVAWDVIWRMLINRRSLELLGMIG